jgi:hypothetical protein
MSDEASELLAMMLGKSLKLSGNLSIKTDHSNNKNDVNILLNVQNN